jgi:hypothetical protein
MMAIPNIIEFICQHIPNDPKHRNKKPNYYKNSTNSISNFQTCDTTTNSQSMHCLFLHTHTTCYILLYELTGRELIKDKKCNNLNKWISTSMCELFLMQFFLWSSQVCKYFFPSSQLTNMITRTPTQHHSHKAIRPLSKSLKLFFTSP